MSQTMRNPGSCKFGQEEIITLNLIFEVFKQAEWEGKNIPAN